MIKLIKRGQYGFLFPSNNKNSIDGPGKYTPYFRGSEINPILLNPIQITSIAGNKWNKIEPYINRYMGIKYVFGGGHLKGDDPRITGLDCSSFINHLYNDAFGIDFNYGGATSIFNDNRLTNITDDKYQKGDLIFLENTSNLGRGKSGFKTHIGVITDVDNNGNILEVTAASQGSRKVVKQKFNNNFWNNPKYNYQVKRLK